VRVAQGRRTEKQKGGGVKQNKHSSKCRCITTADTASVARALCQTSETMAAGCSRMWYGLDVAEPFVCGEVVPSRLSTLDIDIEARTYHV
jgi:hypothetical protein